MRSVRENLNARTQNGRRAKRVLQFETLSHRLPLAADFSDQLFCTSAQYEVFVLRVANGEGEGTDSTGNGGTGSSGNSGGTGTPGTNTGNGNSGGGFIGPKPSLNFILANYQVSESPMTTFDPSIFTSPRQVTEAEKDILEDLSLFQLGSLNSIRSYAYSESEDRAPGPGLEDGHGDAIRHAIAHALIAREFGQEFAQEFGNAHETYPNNPPVREAMDLYNNGVGIRIAIENPTVTYEELSDLIEQAANDGDLVVIDSNGDLQWSNDVQPGQTGHPK